MKFLFLLASLLTINSYASTFNRIPLMTGKLYIPNGFDTNDLVEITVAGTLPDSCHRLPTYEVTKVNNQFNIHLYAYYVEMPEGCRKMALPYVETISLGMLKAGKYKVSLNESQNPKENLPLSVKEAVGALQDDFHYGNVMNIIEDPETREIELIGTNPVDCMQFDKLEAEVQGSVIVLRPKFLEQGVCGEKPTQFRLKYEVPFLPTHPRGLLLHVRVMGGRSLNHLFQNR